MRLGTTVTFLLVALITLGYLLSDTMQTHADLNQVQRQMEQLTRQRDAALQELQQLKSELATVQQTNSVLDTEKVTQAERIRVLEVQNADLQKKLGTYLAQQTRLNLPEPATTTGTTPWLSLAVLIPAVPASMAATYLVIRYSGKRSSRTQASGASAWVQLTTEEAREIGRMRRMRQARQ